MASGFPAVQTTRNAAVNTDIVGKETEDSLDPADVGNNIIENLNALAPFIAQINAFIFTSGSVAPNDLNGSEGDIYQQTNGGVSITIWRKTTTSWVVQDVLPLGISYQDGIIIGLRTQIDVTALSVMVTSGNWAINNVIYQQPLPTIITYDAPEVGSDRIDTIYADTNGDILYLKGAPSGSPVKPTLPANTIEVDSIYIPADGTGSAYLFSSGTANEIPSNPVISATQVDLVDDGGGGWYLPITLPNGFVPSGYAIINKSGVITYLPISLSVDGTTITGFLDNDTQIITIKLI